MARMRVFQFVEEWVYYFFNLVTLTPLNSRHNSGCSCCGYGSTLTNVTGLTLLRKSLVFSHSELLTQVSNLCSLCCSVTHVLPKYPMSASYTTETLALGLGEGGGESISTGQEWVYYLFNSVTPSYQILYCWWVFTMGLQGLTITHHHSAHIKTWTSFKPTLLTKAIEQQYCFQTYVTVSLGCVHDWHRFLGNILCYVLRVTGIWKDVDRLIVTKKIHIRNHNISR